MPGTAQAIVNGLYAALTGDSGAGGVNTLTGGRIYHLQAAQNAAFPLVTFQRVTDVPESRFGDDFLDSEYQVDAWGDIVNGAAPVQTIVARVGTLLDRTAVSCTGWNRVAAHVIGDGLLFVTEDCIHGVVRLQLWGS